MRIPLADKPEARVVEVKTDDGMTIRCRRYARPGARAVVCGHGLASTGYEFDLPLRGFNIADILFQMGYEPWVMNFRGAGSPPWNSEAGDWHHSGDELGCFDLRAVVDRAAEETGRPVFYMGHSFGGMALYMYLQGCVIDGDPPKVRRDQAEGERRNRLVAGAFAVASPMSMEAGGEGWMEKARVHPFVQSMFRAVERMLLRRDRKKPRIGIGESAIRFGFAHPLITKLFMSSQFMKMYMVPANMGAEACRLFGTWSGGDVSALQVAQTVQTVRLGQLDCVIRDADAEPHYCYRDGMSAITSPIVTAAGGMDFMQPRDIRTGVLQAVSSRDVREIVLPGAGHVDLLYQLPFQSAFAWLEEKAAD